MQSSVDANRMLKSARQTTDFLKSIAHEGRLVILCRLVEGPATVSELERLLDVRQAAVSQQLARLRSEGLVNPVRDGRVIRYSIADDRVGQVVQLLHDLFCG